MARGDGRLGELHEVLAWSVLALVALHLAGLFVHFLRTRENLAATMVTGERWVPAEAAIPSERHGAAMVLVALVGAFGALVASGFDVAARRLTLPLIGTQLTIGEAAEPAGEAVHSEAAGDETEEDD
jgi:cytochrome b561